MFLITAYATDLFYVCANQSMLQIFLHLFFSSCLVVWKKLTNTNQDFPFYEKIDQDEQTALQNHIT